MDDYLCESRNHRREAQLRAEIFALEVRALATRLQSCVFP